MPEDAYGVRASKDGYAYEFYDDVYNSADRISVTVSAGQITPNIDFDLARGGVITGVVTEAGSGNPLQGFHVELLFPNTIRDVDSTDENGAYRFDAVPLDTLLYVFAWDWPDGGEHSLEFYDNTGGWDTATPITLTAVMTTLANINFQLDRLGVVTETVVSKTTGGVIVNLDSQGTATTIAIPIGAVTETTTFVYTEVPTLTGETPAGFSFAGSLFSLDAYQDNALVDDFGFAAPITVTLHYSEAALGGIQEDSLELRYWDALQAAWLDAACGAYDRHPDEDWLAVPICHLSEFALFGVAEYKVALPLVMR
ncbi:MAG: carboxypeptidase-like regulatory domain-containing protein [Chloroflexi bacterium]|nr:carboxypeptidase-like regulatory domain-containing protein [Chloroflexota bacterium]